MGPYVNLRLLASGATEAANKECEVEPSAAAHNMMGEEVGFSKGGFSLSLSADRGDICSMCELENVCVYAV